ncbi:hypothetical protein [Mycoplasma seminis]|uniref:DUF31 domain-containing protein n=1 Tax=Mycoplasma seminis TaxID=512749 RepID=A0ABY9HAK6_9MOLU|nr:hypothetical protein [Mycoplasma seminis]WLP85229.1 hypothetical protein Q8852_02815 [Mycoplasma seminis]
MSHGVSAVLSCNELETEQLNKAFNDINKLIDDHIKTVQNTELTNALEQRKQKYHDYLEGIFGTKVSVEGSSTYVEHEKEEFSYEIQKAIDYLNKEYNNLSIVLSNKEYQALGLNANNAQIQDLLSQHGMLGIQACIELQNENKTLNAENLKNKIESIREQAFQEAYQKEFLAKVNEILDTTYTNEKLKLALYKNALNFKTYNEANDYLYLLANKKYYYNKVNTIINTIFTRLKKYENYALVNSDFRIDQDNNVFFRYTFKNPKKETFDIEIDEKGVINYKIGDYAGHCCEKTSAQIFDALEKNHIKVVKRFIYRNVTNQHKTMAADIKGEK